MLILLLIWLVIGIALMALTIEKRLGSAGLPLAYFLALTLNHVPGALLYIDGEELNTSAVITRIGVRADHYWDGMFSIWRGDC